MPISFDQLMEGFQNTFGSSASGGVGSSMQQLQETVERLDETEQERVESAEMLIQAIESTQEVGQAASQQLPDFLSSISGLESIGESFAEAIISPEVIRSIESTENVEDFTNLTQELASYIQQANDLQMQFVDGSIERKQLEEEFNDLQEQTIENLQEQNQEQQEFLGLLEQNFSVAQDAQQGFTNQIEQGRGVSEALNTGLGDAAAPALQLAEIATGWKDTIASAFNVWALGLATVGLVIAEFLTLNNATSKFVEQTGMSVDQSQELVGNLTEVRRQAALSGLEFDDLVDASVELTEQFGSIQAASRALQSTQSEINQEVTAIAGRLRVSGEQAATFVTQFEDVAELTGTTRRSLETSAIQAANIAGVAPKAVFQDIANNAEKLATFSGQSGDKLASAAARARQLGTNIGEVVGIQEQFLSDIPSTFQNIAQASVITGIQFDAQSLVESAAQGTDEFTDTLSRELERINFDDMSFLDKQEVASAFNIGVTQLQRISEQAKQTEDSVASLSEQVESGDVSFADAFAATESFTALERLQNQFSSLLFTVSENLVPVFEALESVLGLVASGITVVADLVALLSDGVSWATTNISDFVGQSEMLVSAWSSVTDMFGGAISSLENVQKTSTGAKASLAGFALEFQNIGSILAGGVIATGLFKLASVFVNTLGFGGGGGQGIISKSISGFGKFFKSTLKSIKGVLTGFIDLITGVLKSALTGVAQAFTSFAQALAPIANPTTLAGLAAFTLTAIGLAGAFNLMSNGLANLIESLGPAREILAGGFADVLNNVSQAFLTLANSVVPIIETLVQGFLSAVVSLGQTAVDILDRMFNGIVQVASAGPQIAVAAAGIAGLAGALTTLTAGGIVSGLANFVGIGFTDQLESIASYADPILMVSNALESLVSSIQRLSSQDIQSQISGISESVGTVAASANVMTPQAVNATSETDQTIINNTSNQQTVRSVNQNETLESRNKDSTVVDALSAILESNKQIVQLIQQGAFDVYLDGRKVTDQLRRRNSTNSLIASG